MNANMIEQLLLTALPECDISVEGGDGKYLVSAVGAIFEGLNAVKRQQKIYAVLNEHIASGAIHAVSMRLASSSESTAN